MKNIQTFSTTKNKCRRYNIPFLLNIFFIVLFTATPNILAGQKNTIAPLHYRLPVIIDQGDTIPNIRLREITIYPRRDLSVKNRYTRKYIRLAYKVRKVYPYARVAVKILQDIQDTLPEMESERYRRRFMRAYDKALRERYMDELKKLKVSEGRILIKLIDRETGKTSYNLVKELRGDFQAFFWQSLARLFGENLKVSYAPRGKDYMIEEIVTKIETGRLEPLPLPDKK